MFAGTAAHIQNAPLEPTGVDQLEEGGLGHADVPRWSPVVGGIEIPTGHARALGHLDSVDPVESERLQRHQVARVIQFEGDQLTGSSVARRAGSYPTVHHLVLDRVVQRRQDRLAASGADSGLRHDPTIARGSPRVG